MLENEMRFELSIFSITSVYFRTQGIAFLSQTSALVLLRLTFSRFCMSHCKTIPKHTVHFLPRKSTLQHLALV
jgi:hypothetical protein